jgi:hypothetical protein
MMIGRSGVFKSLEILGVAKLPKPPIPTKANPPLHLRRLELRNPSFWF